MPIPTCTILLVGLRPPLDEVVQKHLYSKGHLLKTATDAAEAQTHLKSADIDLALLQSRDAAALVADVRTLQPLERRCALLCVCDSATAQQTLDVFRAGAVDLLVGPLTPESLDAALERVCARFSISGSAPSQSETRLHFLDEAGKERWVTIIPPRYTIGRSSANDLVFSNMSISRNHAEIVLEDGSYTLRDLGSKHGTFVNGVRCEHVRLSSGDRIQLGGSNGQNLTFHSGDLLQSLLGKSETRPEISLPVRGFREIGMLLETFRALSSIPLLDDLLALVLDTAIELTGAERGFIMLSDKDDQLSFRCARNNAKRSLDGHHFQTSRRVPEEVYRTGNRVVINDLDFGEGTENHSSTRRLGLRSIFCVPLRYLTFRDAGSSSGVGRMETIGVLYVDSQNIGTGLSSTQVDALETLASEAAMAIYNARLYKDSQEKRKLEEELAIAREIQQASLPPPQKSLPFAEAFSSNLPCREVGGDYFDYFDMEGGRFGFALGDVAGKGMPAALLTSMLQGIFTAQTLLDLPLPAVIANVNRNLVRRSTGNRFVTFFFGILDPDGNCTYTNAGHNPPYLVRRDGAIEELTEGGLVLGLFAAAEYESRTVRLAPGDHIVLFTDGVLEARNTAGEEFGEERLRELLKANAHEANDRIVALVGEQLAAFSANTPQHDDITLMVLSYRGEAPA
jgi:phosphoserine phosphatase RsbU/P